VDDCIEFGNLGFPSPRKLEVSTLVKIWGFQFAQNLGFLADKVANGGMSSRKRLRDDIFCGCFQDGNKFWLGRM
jgi:hypothetical protein